jgi:hypothetical protein
MKKTRGDNPIGAIIHKYMEISQGNFLCSYLYLKLKCHVFHFIFSLKPCLGGMDGTSGSREVLGKEGEHSEIKCVHMEVNAKMMPVETTPETGGQGRMKESG